MDLRELPKIDLHCHLVPLRCAHTQRGLAVPSCRHSVRVTILRIRPVDDAYLTGIQISRSLAGSTGLIETPVLASFMWVTFRPLRGDMRARRSSSGA